MKFKIDENLPVESAAILCESDFDAETVASEKISGASDEQLFERCRFENRILITLDLDFANIQSYPLQFSPGVIVLRPRVQDIKTILSLIKRLTKVIKEKSPERQLWIVEPDRIRFRNSET